MVRKYWSSYTAGALLGLTLLAAFFLMGRGLGASGAISLVTSVGVHAVAPDYASGLKYFSRYLERPSPLMDWNLFLLIGVLLGSLAGALVSGNFKVQFDRAPSQSTGQRFLTALSGGVMIGFAARLARGCTSGVALTGGAQLSLSGWLFVFAMFAAGFLVAAVFRRAWS